MWKNRYGFKCKICDATNFTHHGYCVYNVQTYWHKCKKENIFTKISAKQGICKWLLMIKNKYGCQIHSTYVYITTELKAYWLTWLRLGWPQHRGNQGIWMSIFQTGKTWGIWLQHREKIENTGKKFWLVWFLLCDIFIVLLFLSFQAFPVEILSGGRGSIVVLEHCTKNQ